jgi:hypothetical protein
MKNQNSPTRAGRTSRAPVHIPDPHAFAPDWESSIQAALVITRPEREQIVAGRALAAIGWRLPWFGPTENLPRWQAANIVSRSLDCSMALADEALGWLRAAGIVSHNGAHLAITHGARNPPSSLPRTPDQSTERYRRGRQICKSVMAATTIGEIEAAIGIAGRVCDQ